MSDDSVGFAVVGVGHVGQAHARDLREGKVARGRLAAVCDPDPAAVARFPGVPCFADLEGLIASGLADAVLIATPHYAHTPLAIRALRAGLHVLTEKPLAVQVSDGERMLRAHAERPRAEQRFAVMLNLRGDARYRKLRELVAEGTLGELTRLHWVVTDCFRHDAYYAESPWRGTWDGEGGGVLINQAPHYLDLWQWLFGMPRRVHAFTTAGRFHDIEVEDQVTAYLEHEGGASGVFVTSTGEAPGDNRLEVVGSRATVVLDKHGFRLFQGTSSEVVPHGEARGARSELVQNFVDSILQGDALLAPAEEGLPSVALANALIYSGISRQTLTLPLDPALYDARLTELRRR